MRRVPILVLLLILLVSGGVVSAAPSSDGPVVRAVLFYSPSCPHCHTVINELIVPMMDDYGDQLQVVGINISAEEGKVLYDASTERFGVPPEKQGVPRLIVAETVLVGSLEIPAQFPAIVEQGLAAGGIDWPDIPGLREALAEAETAQEEPTAVSEPSLGPKPEEPTPVPSDNPTDTPEPAPTPTPEEVLALAPDSLPPANPGVSAFPEGGALAAAILGGLFLLLAFAGVRFVSARQQIFAIDTPMATTARSWVIPILAVVGFGVSLYLAYVEITQVEAVCGPLGECNVVQSSEYAQIAGIPIAVLGVLFYVAIFFLWAIQRLAKNAWAGLASRLLLILTLFGVLFSIYLTVLELFVIHAVCAWCLGSAVITGLLLLVVIRPVTGQAMERRSARHPSRA